MRRMPRALSYLTFHELAGFLNSNLLCPITSSLGSANEHANCSGSLKKILKQYDTKIVSFVRNCLLLSHWSDKRLQQRLEGVKCTVWQGF